MKTKKFFLRTFFCLAFLGFTSQAFAQVGINTDTPRNVALDIGNQNAKIAPGIVLPQVTADDLTKIPAIDLVDGLLVYVTKLPSNSDPLATPLLIREITYVPSIYQYQAADRQFKDMSRPAEFKVESKLLVISALGTNQILPWPTGNIIANATYAPVLFSDISKKGLNTDQISFNETTGVIKLERKGTYRLTGMIGLLSGSGGESTTTPFYVVSQFVNKTEVGIKYNIDYIEKDPLDPDRYNQIIFSTIGWSESSTEAYDDGGVTNPIALVVVNNPPFELKLNARGGGGKSSPTPIISGGEPSGTNPSTYIMVEQL